jgi:hypothetical protein
MMFYSYVWAAHVKALRHKLIVTDTLQDTTFGFNLFASAALIGAQPTGRPIMDSTVDPSYSNGKWSPGCRLDEQYTSEELCLQSAREFVAFRRVYHGFLTANNNNLINQKMKIGSIINLTY